MNINFWLEPTDARARVAPNSPCGGSCTLSNRKLIVSPILLISTPLIQSLLTLFLVQFFVCSYT